MEGITRWNADRHKAAAGLASKMVSYIYDVSSCVPVAESTPGDVHGMYFYQLQVSVQSFIDTFQKIKNTVQHVVQHVKILDPKYAKPKEIHDLIVVDLVINFFF